MARGLARRAVRDDRRGLANLLFPLYLVNFSTLGEFGRIISFVLIVLFWFYALALGLLAGAVINALRFELHDTGTARGMTADFPSAELTAQQESVAEADPTPTAEAPEDADRERPGPD